MIQVDANDEIGELSYAFQEMVEYQRTLADTAESIGRGELRVDITPRSAHDKLPIALRNMLEGLRALIDDAQRLVITATQGELNQRADATRHHGAFGEIINGFNQTLDAVLAPINDSTDILERLANYDLSARVDGEYHGDHARIKDALNRMGKMLQDAVAQVAQAASQVENASTEIASSAQDVARVPRSRPVRWKLRPPASHRCKG